jgi:two-component sensor histidine kinase
VFHATPRPLLLIASDPPKYTMVAINAAHARAFSTTPDALKGRGVLEVFPTDSGEDVDAFVEAIRTSFELVLSTGAPHQMPTRRFPVARPDGSTENRYWAATNAPVTDATGRITYIVSAIEDVTGEVLERRNAEARQLLMREVDHRSRNALTVVQTFVRLTVAPTVEAFRKILDGRVEALARAQTSLLARQWEGGELTDILEGELAAMAPSGRYDLSGAPVLLRPDDVQGLTMVIHELVTNACKYGALSQEGGTLRVKWSKAGECLNLTWTEAGGPPVAPPAREGFGSRLVRQLARQLRGEVRFDWRPEGLCVTVKVPLAEG